MTFFYIAYLPIALRTSLKTKKTARTETKIMAIVGTTSERTPITFSDNDSTVVVAIKRRSASAAANAW